MDVPKSLGKVLEQIGFGRFQILLVCIGGIMQTFDAMEMLILAYLQPILRCAWQITVWEETILTAGVFIGMMIGGLLLGRLSDMFGRKYVIFTASCLLAYMSMLSAASPSIIWMTIVRGVVGLNLGGLFAAQLTLASELMPIVHRDMALILIFAFWPLGSYLMTILCITVVPIFGWRIFLLILGIFMVIYLPLVLWLPESPRFLLLKLRKSEALDVLNRMARFNRKVPILDVIEPEQQKYSLWDIFHKNYRFTTFLTTFLWMTSGLTYYGIILIVTVIDSIPRQCLQDRNLFHKPQYNFTSVIDDSCCVPITWSSSVNTFISTTGELISIPIAIIMAKVIGRKYSLAIFTLFISITFVIINICMPPLLMSAILLAMRGAIYGTFKLNYLFTAEVFPTSVRGVALGVCGTASRIGGIFAPLIVNYIGVKYSFINGTVVFTVLNIFSCFAALILPYETKDRPLFQTAED